MQCCLVSKFCPTPLQPHGLQPTRLLCPWDFPDKNAGVGCHFLIQRIFLTLWSFPRIKPVAHDLQVDSLSLSYQGSPGRLLSSVQFSCSVVSNFLLLHEPQHTRPPCPSPTPRVYPNPCPSGQWCHPAISSSVIPFSSCPQFLPASGSFPVSQLFTSRGQSTGVSASASVLPMSTQDWSPLGWTGWISLQSKGLSRVFCNTTVQKHQLSGPQLSLESNSHIHTWPLEKP